MAEVLDQQQSLNNTWAGFGEFAIVRYRGQGFKPVQPLLTAISFQRGGGFNNKGLKVYIDNADGDSFPIHTPEEALYSFVIPNADLDGGSLTKYDLPIPLEVTPNAQYVFYLAPWDEGTDSYSDDYADARWYNVDIYSRGKPIVYSGGGWSVTDLGDFDMYFETYGDELPEPPPPIPQPDPEPVFPDLTPAPISSERITYRLVVKDGSGNNLGEFERYKNLRFTKRLNNYGECSFSVPVNDPKIASLIALRIYTVHIYRDELLLWAGEQAVRQGALDDKGGNWATITCYDWFEQWFSRYTAEEVTFTGIDAGQIAWDMIDTAQGEANGDFGITEGTIEATQNRDRTYYNQNIGEAIVNLSNIINGFDFEINTSKVFNVASVIGVDRSDEIRLEYGINVRSIRITEDFSKPVNRGIVIGDSGVLAEPLRVERDNVTSQGIYKIREDLSNEMSVSETETLEEKGDAMLRKFQEPLIKISMEIVRSTTPTIADFAIGDIIKLIIKTGIYDMNENFRIYEWGVSWDQNDTETLSLTLGNFYLPEFS